MASPAARQHETWAQPYAQRAYLPNTPQLTSYVFRLMALKKTNLCLSADVQSTSQLLDVAEEVGDSICILKTHADAICDFGDRTIKGLTEIATRKKFLIFEDRKFGDIGNTVQTQYAAGPYRIASWASITNAHIFPGPAIITSLKEAALSAVAAYNSSISTEITGGSLSEGYFGSATNDGPGANGESFPYDIPERSRDLDMRKGSVVSISTTISSSTEYNSPPTHPYQSSGPATPSAPAGLVDRPPLARGLLLLAQMSSVGNLLTPEYTQKAIEMAREQPDFVIGFIAQEALNSKPGDNFITMTPGCNLPPVAPGTSSKRSSTGSRLQAQRTSPTSTRSHTSAARPLTRRQPHSPTRSPALNEEASLPGDGKGQQYNTPRHLILEKGVDVVIVGRGILGADDRASEAERFRQEAWGAYLERVGGQF